MTFLSPTDHPPGAVQRVQLKLPGPSGNATVVLKVRIGSSRATQSGRFVCLGQVVDCAASLDKVGPAQTLSDPCLRGAPRVPRRLRIMGKALPNFQALSVDFSPGGLQIEGQGPQGLQVGAVLDLTIDSEPPVECRARVAWCTLEERAYRAGLAFLEEEEELAPAASPPAEPPAVQGTVEGFRADDREAVLRLRIGGALYWMRFPGPRVVRDQRGLAGSDFADALEVEASPLSARVRRQGGLRLGECRELTHYRLLSPKGEVVFEVVCEGAVEQRAGGPRGSERVAPEALAGTGQG